MKVIVIIATLMVHAQGFALEITPREWVGFLYQMSKRAPAQLSGDDAAFSVENRDANHLARLTLVGKVDTEGGFTPVQVIALEQTRQAGGYLVVATTIGLDGEIKFVQKRAYGPQSAQKEEGEPPMEKPSEEQKAAWSKALEAWRAQVGQLPERSGRLGAKEVAI